MLDNNEKIRGKKMILGVEKDIKTTDYEVKKLSNQIGDIKIVDCAITSNDRGEILHITVEASAKYMPKPITVKLTYTEEHKAMLNTCQIGDIIDFEDCLCGHYTMNGSPLTRQFFAEKLLLVSKANNHPNKKPPQ